MTLLFNIAITNILHIICGIYERVDQLTVDNNPNNIGDFFA